MSMRIKSQRLVIGLTLLLGLAGAAVSYVGVQDRGLPVPVGTANAVEPSWEDGPVFRIDLTHDEAALPPGPNRELFQVSCTICHSPRLALTQPRHSEAQWTAVVHKMVAAYGAPLSKEQERDIVGYLAALSKRDDSAAMALSR